MSLLRKSVVSFVFVMLTACGFRPLYVGQGTDDSISGKQLTQELAAVFIDEIPDRTGQILHRSLVNRLTPHGESQDPRYRLAVRLSEAAISQQGVRQDNLATRYVMTFTAYYTLYSYPETVLCSATAPSGAAVMTFSCHPMRQMLPNKRPKNALCKFWGTI